MNPADRPPPATSTTSTTSSTTLSTTTTKTAAKQTSLRAIATFEAVKGVTALAACLGLLSLVHHDLHHLAEALIGHIGLDPGAHYPTLILHDLDALRDANLRSVVLVASAYAVVRLAEAYGLWNDRAWSKWLGACSGAIYVPFELRHLIHKPTATSAVVLICNVAVVGFLAWQLWTQRSRYRDPART